MTGFDRAQREYDNRTPEDPEEFECDECGSTMERFASCGDEGWLCDRCGTVIVDIEPDFEDYDGILGEG